MQSVDLKFAQDVIRGLPDAVVASILAAFESDVLHLVEQMSLAGRHRDAAALRFAAHSLAGVSANLGARYLTTLARAVHAAGLHGTELLDAVQAEVPFTLSAVRQILTAHRA